MSQHIDIIDDSKLTFEGDPHIYILIYADENIKIWYPQEVHKKKKVHKIHKKD